MAMSQPYGLGAGVVPPPGPPPAPPQWQQPGYPPTPAPPRRRVWPTLAVTGAFLATAVIAGVAGALIVQSSDTPATPAQPAASAPSQASAPTPADATAALCTTLEREYPAIVAAINDRNKYNKTPWTDPAIVASSENLARVTWEAADELEKTFSTDLPARYRTPAVEYVAGLRAMSISERDRAKDMQLNGVGAFYNSVVDPVLAVCDMEG